MPYSLQGFIGHDAGPFAAFRQHCQQGGRIVAQIGIALLHGPQRLHRGLREQRLEGPPTHGGAFGGGAVPAPSAEQGIEAQEIVGLGAFGVAELKTHQGIRLGPLDLFGDQVGWIQQGDAGAFIRIALAHFAAAVREAHHPGALAEDQGLGHLEQGQGLPIGPIRPEAGVDALLSDVARQFEVLFLVFPHRHPIGVIEKDVGGHQHRVIEQPGRHIGPLLQRLLLELDHPLQPVEWRHAIEQPAEFAVGAHLALHEHGGALRIDATGQV